MKKISITTPCYNEEGNVYNMYVAIKEIMNTLPNYTYEHLFIDNCSQDKTQDILRQICAEDKHVKAVFNERNFGPNASGAYITYQITGDACIGIPCDFQEPPQMIPEFIKFWEEGYKVVFGKKTSSSENRLMYLIRRLYYKIIKLFSNIPQYEQTTGFGIYDRSVVDLLKRSNNPMPNFRNMIAEFGIEVKFIEYHQSTREWGHSSYNFFSYFDLAINSLINTSLSPIRLATLTGTAFTVISLFAMVASLVYMCFEKQYNLLLLILLSIFLIGGILLTFIGVIGEYIGNILLRVKNNPLVIEKERLNFEEDNTL